MFRKDISGIPMLIDLVGAGNPNPRDNGPTVVTGNLWDGRVVTATYYRGPKYQNPDAETREDVFWDDGVLRPLVEKMLEKGESFVTVTGTDDAVCCLEWAIKTH